jgi:hypothetical protein
MQKCFLVLAKPFATQAEALAFVGHLRGISPESDPLWPYALLCTHRNRVVVEFADDDPAAVRCAEWGQENAALDN